jgi:hypothetical protein
MWIDPAAELAADRDTGLELPDRAKALEHRGTELVQAGLWDTVKVREPDTQAGWWDTARGRELDTGTAQDQALA